MEGYRSKEAEKALRKAIENSTGELFLERPKERGKRRSGNTTRLVDYYVQVLFRDGKAKIEDYDDVPRAHRILAGKIADRILNEHNIEVNVYLKKGIYISIK